MIGVACVAIDFFFYYLTSQYIDVSLAKALGFLSGTFANYHLNKYWTWKARDKNHKRLLRYSAVYGTSMIVNIVSNNYFLSVISDHELVIQFMSQKGEIIPILAFKFDKILAFLLSVAISVVINFAGQKLWVFKTAEDEVE